MSRCSSFCSSKQLIKDTDPSERVQDGKSVSIGPVLSVACLHDDNEESKSSEDSSDESDNLHTEDIVEENVEDMDPPQRIRDGESVSIGPVLSVACLHDDNDVTPVPENNGILDVKNTAGSSGSTLNSDLLDKDQNPASSEDPDFIYIHEIPELIVTFCEEDTQESSVEMNDLMMQSVEDDYHHPTSAPATEVPHSISLERQIADVQESASPLSDNQVEMKKEIPKSTKRKLPITVQKKSSSGSNSNKKHISPKETFNN